MEVLKRAAHLGVLLALLPFALGNKGCEEGKTIEHPLVSSDANCQECHEPGISTKTKPTGHDQLWTREHGRLIQRYGMQRSNTCVICHSSSVYCTDCHQQQLPADHNQFFRLKGHGMQLGLNRSRCETCHRSDFCERCHANTRPADHAAGWGSPGNRHCVGCHFPIDSAGGQKCVTCHKGTPSHNLTPRMPSNALHGPGANCRSCHTPLRHPDSGATCETCHQRS